MKKQNNEKTKSFPFLCFNATRFTANAALQASAKFVY